MKNQFFILESFETIIEEILTDTQPILSVMTRLVNTSSSTLTM